MATARLLVRLAGALLPRGREAWGRAMAAELDDLESTAALDFAIGCVLAAGEVRLRDAATSPAAARLILAAAAGAVAAAHLVLAWGGVLALRYGRDADVVAQLRQAADGGRSLHAYLRLRAPATAMLISLAASQVAVAASLARWNLRAFLPSYSAAVVSALALAAVVVLCGLPNGLLPSDAVLLGGEAAAVLLLELQGRSRP